MAKSWLGLDLAVSVASGTPALGRFPVDATGPALVYLAEDALPRVRDRVSHLCRHRGLHLSRLDMQVVTADRLRLDTERDQLALDQTVQRIRPALLLLDPLVRLHSLDENSASDISSLLAFLRAINRRHQLALVLVHHMAKRSSRNLGQSLRGSSDLHAWTDSACYLVRRPDDRLQLTVEHRSAPAPDPLLLRLSGGGDQPLSLLVDSADAPPPPLPVISRRNGRISGALPRQKSNRSESEAASILWTVRRVLYSVRTDRRSPPVHRRRGSRRCRVNLHGSAARAGEPQQEVFGSLVNQVVTARNLDLLRRCQLPLGSVVEAGGRRHQGPGWTEITPNSLISSTGMTPDTTPASSATIIECQQRDEQVRDCPALLPGAPNRRSLHPEGPERHVISAIGAIGQAKGPPLAGTRFTTGGRRPR